MFPFQFPQFQPLLFRSTVSATSIYVYSFTFFRCSLHISLHIFNLFFISFVHKFIHMLYGSGAPHHHHDIRPMAPAPLRAVDLATMIPVILKFRKTGGNSIGHILTPWQLVREWLEKWGLEGVREWGSDFRSEEWGSDKSTNYTFALNFIIKFGICPQ